MAAALPLSALAMPAWTTLAVPVFASSQETGPVVSYRWNRVGESMTMVDGVLVRVCVLGLRPGDRQFLDGGNLPENPCRTDTDPRRADST